MGAPDPSADAPLELSVVPVTAFQQNTSLLRCTRTGAVAVVDPGGEPERIEAALSELGGELACVLLTHCHLDHAGATAELAEAHGVPVVGPQREDQFWIDSLPEQAAMFGFPPARTFAPDRWLEHGDTATVGELELEVLHCPGHTPGHVVFFHRASQMAWVGDVLFQGSIGRTDFPRGDHATLLRSIRDRLLPLGDEVRFLPGHGPMSTLGHERRTNPFLTELGAL